MKVSTAVIRRPKQPDLPKVFTDPANPDCAVPMRLRKLGSMEFMAVLDSANERAQMYVTGWGDPNEPGYTPPIALPPVDGQAVVVSMSTCRVAAGLEFAQIASDEDRYSFEEIVSFMTVDAICDQMAEAFAEIQPGGAAAGDPLGKTSGKESSDTALVDTQ